MILGRPVAKPLYGFGGVEVIGGKIASPLRKRTLNDPSTFEITQTAAQHVASGRGTAVAAIDIANGFCGEPLLAMLAGSAQRVTDPSGALGVRITSGHISVELWHLQAWAIGTGTVTVTPTTIVGYLGATGLSVGGCHCHIEVKVNGVNVDPEPYVLLGLPLEDDVLVSKTDPLRESVRIVTGPASAIRTDTVVNASTLDYRTGDPGSTPPFQFTAIGVAAGDVYPAGSTNNRWYVFLKRGEGLRAIHSGVCEVITTPAPVADCTEEVTAAKQAGLQRVDRIKSRLAAAVQEIAGL